MFLAFPMEAHTDGDITKRERHIIALRLEAQLAIVLSAPQQATLG